MADTQNENGQVVKKETTEIIDNGQTLNSQNSNLASIFDKLEAGKEDGISNKEALKDEGKVVESAPQKKEDKKEVVAEVKEEKTDLEKKLDATVEAKGVDEEVTREKLLAATEKKADKGPAKAEDKKESGEEVPEEELQVLPHDKPKTAKRIQALLKRAENLSGEFGRTKAEKESIAKERDELVEKLKTVKTVDPKVEEDVKKNLDELAMYRRRYELDKDPEVKTKFDSRVDSAESAITATLVKRNAGKGLLDLIKEEGGWSKFSESNRIVTIPDGEGGNKSVTAAEMSEAVLQALPLGDRKAIEAAMVDQINTRRDKDRYLKEQQDQAVEYFKKKETEASKGSEEYQKQVEESKKVIEEYKKKTLDSEWIKDKPVPANASPVEKAAIEEHNKYNSQLRTVFNKAIGTKSLNDLLEVVTDSVRFYDERRVSSSLRKENEALKAQLEAKQKEYDKFRTAGRSVGRSGSIATAPAHDSTSSDRPKSLDEAFDRLDKGESLSKKSSIADD